MSASFELSRNQIDRLGDRLRAGKVSDDDLRLLDKYRRSFENAYQHVIRRIFDELGLAASGRPEKTNTSIVQKLRRQSIRLSQVQDIAGCRIVIPDLLTQDEAIARLRELFLTIEVDDRRERPSHGYRAVHLIIETSGKLIEVQVRTYLQDQWAAISEKLSGEVDIDIKYGGGDRDTRVILDTMSQKIREHELAEAAHLRMMTSNELDWEIEFLEGFKVAELMVSRSSILQMLGAIGEVIPRLKGRK